MNSKISHFNRYCREMRKISMQILMFGLVTVLLGCDLTSNENPVSEDPVVKDIPVLDEAATLVPGRTMTFSETLWVGTPKLGHREVRTIDTTVNGFRVSPKIISKALFATLMRGDSLFFRNCCRGQGEDPVDSVSFYDAIRFCNAYSKGMGLDTTYSYSRINFPEEGRTNLWSLIDLKEDRSRNGFRLPDPLNLSMAFENGNIGDEGWEWAYGCSFGFEMTYFQMISGTIEQGCSFDSGMRDGIQWLRGRMSIGPAFSRVSRFRVIRGL